MYSLTAPCTAPRLRDSAAQIGTRSNDDPHNPLILQQQTVNIDSRDLGFKLRVGIDGASAAASISMTNSPSPVQHTISISSFF